MNEIDIKVEALAWIRRACRGRSLPVVTTEFSLNGTGIRADLAVLGEDFCGIEIKSFSDTLKRLPSQMEGYARYFDETMLIIAAKHEKNLEGVDLKSACVWAVDGPNRRRFIRPGNRKKVLGHTLLGLLTANEERRAVQSIGTHAIDEADKHLRSAFEAAFRRRYGRTSAEFWLAVKGRAIRTDDLKLLSRFYPDRARAEETAKSTMAKWSNWVSQMNDLHVQP